MLKADPGARPLAGGQSLIPAMKLRLSAPETLVDLQAIGVMRGLSVRGSTIAIGAMSTHAEVAESDAIQRICPAVAALAADIGDPMVRSLGTIGGSIANNDPAADYAALLLALDAVVITSGRSVPASEFLRGLYETALEPGELVVAVELQIPQRAAYVKFPQAASHFAIVGVFVAMYSSGVRVAVTGASQTAFRLPPYEEGLKRHFAPDSIPGGPIARDDLNSDMHASAEYRAEIIPHIARRAVAIAAGR